MGIMNYGWKTQPNIRISKGKGSKKEKAIKLKKYRMKYSWKNKKTCRKKDRCLPWVDGVIWE